MYCSGCGAEINENAQACPKCGCPTQKTVVRTKYRPLFIVIGILGAIFFGYCGGEYLFRVAHLFDMGIFDGEGLLFGVLCLLLGLACALLFILKLGRASTAQEKISPTPSNIQTTARRRFCIGCGAEINENALACPQCGCPTQTTTVSTKSRKTYIILGIFFGALGIHNFYAERTGFAIGQLLVTILSMGYLSVISWIWAIIDIIIVKKDGEGKDFV